MKKKFDFSAEIERAEARTNQEYRERYEEENKLLKVNAEELMKLNDNIHEMRIGLEKLANAVQHYKYKVPTRAFYISVICLVSLFCFFICTEAANIHLIKSHLLWKIAGWNIGMAIILIGMIILVTKGIERWK